MRALPVCRTEYMISHRKGPERHSPVVSTGEQPHEVPVLGFTSYFLPIWLSRPLIASHCGGSLSPYPRTNTEKVTSSGSNKLPASVERPFWRVPAGSVVSCQTSPLDVARPARLKDRRRTKASHVAGLESRL